MKYDFDKITDRTGTDAVKFEALKTLFKGEDLIPLWVADMDFETPDFIREAVIKRAEHEIYGYTLRPKRFYETIAAWMKKRHNWEVNPGQIDFSPGVVPALVLAVLGFTEPGDKVLVQSPVYFPFFTTIENHKRELVNNKLIYDNGSYSIDFDDLEQKFRAGVKMMFLCHPHNPVGRAWRRNELEELGKLAVKYNVLVFSDEIHSDLILPGYTHIPLATINPEIAKRTITAIAPSKTFNLAGLHTSAVIIENQELKKKYEQILDAIHIGGGNIFGNVALEAAYEQGEQWLDQLLVYLEGNYLYIKDFLKDNIPDVRLSNLEATYLAWMNFSFLKMKDEELMEFIVKKGKLALLDGPRFGPGGEGYLRMNIASPRSIIEKSMHRLSEAINA